MPPLTDPSPRWPRIFGALAVCALIAALALDILDPAFNSWAGEHSVVVNSGCGALIVAITALVVERFVAARAARRWRVPSLLAIEAYNFPADRAMTRIYARVEAELSGGSEQAGGTRVESLEQALLQLAERDPAGLDRLAEFVRQEADELALVAMQVTGVTSRSGQFDGVVGRIFDQQRRLAVVSEQCSALRFVSGAFSGPHGQSAYGFAVEGAGTADKAMGKFVDELAALQIQLQEELFKE